MEPKPKNINSYSFSHSKYGRQIFSAFAANMGAFSFGTAWAYTATALPSMKEDPSISAHISQDTESLLTSLLFLGCILASPLNGYWIERWGRRGAMMATNVPCVIAWLVVGLSSNVNVVLGARLVTGICSASYGSAAPLYVSEISTPSIRGRLVCTFDTMIAAGMVFINIVGAFTDWRVQAFVCSGVPIVAHILLMMSAESPRYFVSVQRDQEAEQSYAWFHPTCSEEEVRKNVEEIAHCAELDRLNTSKYGLAILLERDVAKPILIGIMLMFFHLMCGNYPILAYGLSALDHSRVKPRSPGDYLGITLMNFAQFIFSIVPVLFVDQIGRRRLLIVSELVMGVTLSCLGFSLWFSSPNNPWAWTFSTTALIIYEIFYALGIGPIPWLLLGELVSSKRPGISLAIITIFYRALGFLELYYFLGISNVVGQAGVYTFFAGCCFLGGLCCYLVIPDTTKLKLEEIRDKV